MKKIIMLSWFIVLLLCNVVSLVSIVPDCNCILEVNAAPKYEVELNRVYGGAKNDSASSVIQTSEGGFAIVGITYSDFYRVGDYFFRDVALWVLKTGTTGQVEWNYTYGFTTGYYWIPSIQSVFQTSEGNFTLVGRGESGLLLVKIDTNGEEFWNRTLEDPPCNPWATSAIQISDEGFILTEFINGIYYAGSNDGPSTCEVGSFGNVSLTKTDANGEFQWKQSYDGGGSERGHSVIQTADNGYAILGTMGAVEPGSGFPGKTNFWLVKTDANGKLEWEQTFGGGEDDSGHSVIQTADGGYALAGTTGSYGAGKDDVWLLKTDASGKLEWEQTFGGREDDSGHSVIQTADGGYALAGTTGSYGAGKDDIWLLITDANGKLQWTQTFGGTESERVHSLIQTTDESFVIVGETGSNNTQGLDAWFLKVKIDKSDFTAPQTSPSLTSIFTIFSLLVVIIFRKRKEHHKF